MTDESLEDSWDEIARQWNIRHSYAWTRSEKEGREFDEESKKVRFIMIHNGNEGGEESRTFAKQPGRWST